MKATNKLLSTQEKMNQSLRKGLHATVYEVQRDPSLKNKDILRDKSKPVFPFVHGSKYIGQWNGDKKDGFGIQVNKNDTKYEGEWAQDKYQGRGTLWITKNKKYVRQYVGDWVDGSMEGEGVYYYENGEVYRGGWIQNKRVGQGMLTKANGDVYSGEWRGDLQHGFGTMNYENGNVYEGLWACGMKEGPGLFYYASTQKIYQGEWLEDQPRCGEYRELNAEEDFRFVKPLPKGLYYNDFKLPEIGVADPKNIINAAVAEVRMHGLEKSGNVSTGISKEDIERANKAFSLYANSDDGGTIALINIGAVLNALGLLLSTADVDEIMHQLELQDAQEVTFTEIVEIGAYITAGSG